jgi:hypothetical protein
VPDARTLALLARARTAYFGFPYDGEQRRMIEHIDRRLSSPDIEPADERLLAARLTDIIRPRTPGSFA